MSTVEKKAKVSSGYPDLSMRQQCQILHLPRSSFYYQPQGVDEPTLDLMKRMDQLFTEYPFFGSRQLTACLHRQGVEMGRHGTPFDAFDGTGGDL